MVSKLLMSAAASTRDRREPAVGAGAHADYGFGKIINGRGHYWRP